jgi:cyclin L
LIELDEAMESFLLPDDILNEATPSRSSGLSEQDEKLNRIFGCEVIQQVGELMSLRQAVMVIAQNLLHRFYYR